MGDGEVLDKMEKSLESINERLRAIEIKMAVVETKAAVWGGIGGFVLSVIVGMLGKIL